MSDVDHLALLVVYYLKDDDDLPLLELHLERIARHTSVPHTVYGIANRTTPVARRVLERRDGVTLCDVPPVAARGSREHGAYLDALVARALADGASHLCTLDVDSFPIADDWVGTVADLAPPASGLAGVLRAENGDVALPHPSCVFTRRDFYERFRPSFAPDSDGSPDLRRFLRATGQSADTGIRLAEQLWLAGLPWGRLLRTNVVDAHPLMAGIYADAVFHLGGTGRGKVFRADLEGSTPHRWSAPIERLPVRGERSRHAKQALLHSLRGRAEARIAARNRAVYAVVRGWLLSDPDGLFAFLRGERPTNRP